MLEDGGEWSEHVACSVESNKFVHVGWQYINY